MRTRLEDLLSTGDRQMAAQSYDAAIDTYRTASGEPGAIEAGVPDRLETALRKRDEAHGIVRPVAPPPAPKIEVSEPEPHPEPEPEPEDLEPLLLPRTTVTAMSAQYTSLAREKKIEGVVRLAVEVDADGTPTVVRVLKGLQCGLDERAAEAVNAMHFQPPRRNGRPVRGVGVVDVKFRLL